MRYLHTMVRVADLEAALSFYVGALGLVEVKRAVNETGRFTLVFLAADEDEQQAQYGDNIRGQAVLELTYNWPDADGKPEILASSRAFGHLAYEVDNIYATCQKLVDHGIEINRPPRDGKMAFVRSPEGISIEILQKGVALAPSAPWSDMANIGSW